VLAAYPPITLGGPIEATRAKQRPLHHVAYPPITLGGPIEAAVRAAIPADPARIRRLLSAAPLKRWTAEGRQDLGGVSADYSRRPH